MAKIFTYGTLEIPDVMAMVKRALLAEASLKAEISRDVDPIISALEDAELKRLQDVLDMLIPVEVPA